MSIDSRALPETVAFLQSAILRLQTTVDDLVRRVQRLEDDTKASSLAVDDRKLKVLVLRHWVAHGFFLPKALSPELVAQMVANAELAIDPSPAGVHKELTRRIQEVHSREFSELVQRVKLSVRDVVKARSANAWARHSFSRGVFRSMDEMRSAIFGSDPRAASSAAVLNQLCLLRVLAQQSLGEANEGKNVNMRRLFDTEMSRVLQLGADDLAHYWQNVREKNEIIAWPSVDEVAREAGGRRAAAQSGALGLSAVPPAATSASVSVSASAADAPSRKRDRGDGGGYDGGRSAKRDKSAAAVAAEEADAAAEAAAASFVDAAAGGRGEESLEGGGGGGAQ